MKLIRDHDGGGSDHGGGFDHDSTSHHSYDHHDMHHDYSNHSHADYSHHSHHDSTNGGPYLSDWIGDLCQGIGDFFRPAKSEDDMPRWAKMVLLALCIGVAIFLISFGCKAQETGISSAGHLTVLGSGKVIYSSEPTSEELDKMRKGCLPMFWSIPPDKIDTVYTRAYFLIGQPWHYYEHWESSLMGDTLKKIMDSSWDYRIYQEQGYIRWIRPRSSDPWYSDGVWVQERFLDATKYPFNDKLVIWSVKNLEPWKVENWPRGL